MPIGTEPQPNTPERKEKINLRILVADDELKNILVATLGLKYSSVEGVDDGQALVNKVSNPNYAVDFIVTDNSMPKMTGLEAIKSIRAMDHLRMIPIIMCTSDTGDLKTQIEALGAVFMEKPFTPDQLYAEIEKIRQKINS